MFRILLNGQAVVRPSSSQVFVKEATKRRQIPEHADGVDGMCPNMNPAKLIGLFLASLQHHQKGMSRTPPLLKLIVCLQLSDTSCCFFCLLCQVVCVCLCACLCNQMKCCARVLPPGMTAPRLSKPATTHDSVVDMSHRPGDIPGQSVLGGHLSVLQVDGHWCWVLCVYV